MPKKKPETEITASVRKREGIYSAVVVAAGPYRSELILPHHDAEEVARRINEAEERDDV